MLILIGVVLAIFGKADAAGIKEYKGMTPLGHHVFNVDGEMRLCQPLGGGKVECLTEKDVHMICDYRDAPEYFVNCRMTNAMIS